MLMPWLLIYSAIRMGGSSQVLVPQATSDGELEVDQSGGDNEAGLLSPGLVGLKVQTQDLEDVVLDKGLWAATPGVRQGWRIFMGVSSSPHFSSYLH